MQCSNCGNSLRPDTKFCTKCGALVNNPTPSPPRAQPAQPAQPVVSFGDAPRAPLRGSSMGRPQRKSGCGKVLLILGIIGVLGLVGIGIAGYFGYKYAQEKIKSSEAYTVAIAALKAHPEVRARMGEIKETGFPIGSFNESADGSGEAAYTVSVVGTKARGQYYAVMRREQRKWRLVSGRLTMPDGDAIEVKSAEDEALSDDTPGTDDNAAAPPPGTGKSTKGVVSMGVLNGKATSKPEPAYPPVAKGARASGTVVVSVVVDETGKVISAKPSSGHPLLRAAAAAAAKQARFTPTLLSGKPVKVSGILTYNFAAP